MNNLVFVFPGQGSQSVGMLNDLYASYPQIQHQFARASDVLNVDLMEMISTDTHNQLNLTEFTQPALLTASVAIWQLWQEKTDIKPTYMAGHSLGEYSALVCAGALDFEDAVSITNKRGQYMQQAVPAGTGAMAAVLGLSDAEVEEICKQADGNDNVTAANFNSPGQVVISGSKQAVEKASELAKAAGAKRVMPLSVSVPSHCQLMRPAAEKLAEDLTTIKIKSPLIPVVHNVDVLPHISPENIKIALVKQLYQSVKWTQTNQFLLDNKMHHVVECGPAKVLSGLAKRFSKEWSINSLATTKGFEKALTLGEQS
ncbi:MAG TPA: [acyl-carrier-protein] S-malonyltransferase [Oceanospirillales bacterium]|nr:[acyl-carrier-protein] S-malonyltransferase [Oceanospirillales bacterium]